MNNVNNQISRMKAMMTYGLQTESKNNQYSGVEYQRAGADGKTYGIVREGTKFYIKVANKQNNVIKEDFNYIGGFRNRKDYEYSSYANALKNFEMKMSSINESVGNRTPMVESWNPERKELLMVEATESMRREIARQREIMNNAVMIQEKKNYSAVMEGDGCCKVDSECAKTQKNNIKKTSDGKGEPTGNGGDPFTEKVDSEQNGTQKTNVKKEYKPVMEGEQVLGWNENEDYLDTSNGTEIGDGAPFNKELNSDSEMENGTVEEGVAMHNTDNQNSPEVGVNEVGDDAPFTEKANNELQEDDELDGELIDDEEPLDADSEGEFDDEDDFDADLDDEEFNDDDLEDEELDSEDLEDEEFDETESRLSAMEDMIAKIAEKLGVDAFEDDSLYDDDEEIDAEDEFDDEDDYDSDDEFDDEGDYDSEDEDESEDEEDYEVFESVAYRKLMQEEKMDYFGKHPAYRKKPMDVPSSQHQEMQDYYDMNDDSVKSEQPFGQEIGDGAPFEVDPEEITNAIAESIKRVLKKKI